MNFQITLANLDDAVAIRHLAEKTFRDTYTQYNTPENMEGHVIKNFNFEQIKKDIQLPDNQYFTVKLASEIIGFAKLIKGHSTEGLAGKNVVEIERFYVDKSFHGQQLGRKLMDFCLAWSIENNFEVIWLGVWEKNENAMKFYQKMGFEFLGKHTFVLGTEAQTDFTMKLDLK
jgi:diamine N-acetyltransferase